LNASIDSGIVKGPMLTGSRRPVSDVDNALGAVSIGRCYLPWVTRGEKKTRVVAKVVVADRKYIFSPVI
jgi:hypothetical protein